MTSSQAQRFKENKLDLCKYLHQLPDLPADLITAFSFIMPFQTSAQRRRRAAGRRARLWRRLLILYSENVS